MSHESWVLPVVMEGKRVRLEPLSIVHAVKLARIADDDLFRFFAGFRPQGRDAKAGEEFIRNVNAQANKVSFAIIDKTTKQPVGATSFMDIRDKHRGLEIGSTWLAPAAQGTAVNPESKLLMLTHAFETLGAIRVQFRTDTRNLQSQRAIEKLGATRDGIFRQDCIMPDGFIRDSVFYSIVPEEWPAVKTKLMARLAAFGGPERIE
ncbi:MAG: GNAT family N-acetyltransferase [Fimbriimonadales bacterium]